MIGGLSSASQSIEFWSPTDPEEGSCELNDYPREMLTSPTANLVSGQLVACYDDSCEICNAIMHCNGGEWNRLVETRSTRAYPSSAVKEDRILLIGGSYSRSTEWIPVDGSPSHWEVPSRGRSM